MRRRRRKSRAEIDQAGDIDRPSSGPSSNSSSRSSGHGGSSNDRGAPELPKGEARSLQRGDILVSDERWNQRRAEEPASGSWHALLVDLAHQGEETDPEEGFGRYEFGELSD